LKLWSKVYVSKPKSHPQGRPPTAVATAEEQRVSLFRFTHKQPPRRVFWDYNSNHHRRSSIN